MWHLKIHNKVASKTQKQYIWIGDRGWERGYWKPLNREREKKETEREYTGDGCNVEIMCKRYHY